MTDLKNRRLNNQGCPVTSARDILSSNSASSSCCRFVIQQTHNLLVEQVELELYLVSRHTQSESE